MALRSSIHWLNALVPRAPVVLPGPWGGKNNRGPGDEVTTAAGKRHSLTRFIAS